MSQGHVGGGTPSSDTRRIAGATVTSFAGFALSRRAHRHRAAKRKAAKPQRRIRPFFPAGRDDCQRVVGFADAIGKDCRRSCRRRGS